MNTDAGDRVPPTPAAKQALLDQLEGPDVIVTVRMPAELRDRLSAIAARNERSLAACIRYFLISDVRAWERSHAYWENRRQQKGTT